MRVRSLAGFLLIACFVVGGCVYGGENYKIDISGEKLLIPQPDGMTLNKEESEYLLKGKIGIGDLKPFSPLIASFNGNQHNKKFQAAGIGLYLVNSKLYLNTTERDISDFRMDFFYRPSRIQEMMDQRLKKSFVSVGIDPEDCEIINTICSPNGYRVYSSRQDCTGKYKKSGKSFCYSRISSYVLIHGRLLLITGEALGRGCEYLEENMVDYLKKLFKVNSEVLNMWGETEVDTAMEDSSSTENKCIFLKGGVKTYNSPNINNQGNYKFRLKYPESFVVEEEADKPDSFRIHYVGVNHDLNGYELYLNSNVNKPLKSEKLSFNVKSELFADTLYVMSDKEILMGMTGTVKRERISINNRSAMVFTFTFNRDSNDSTIMVESREMNVFFGSRVLCLRLLHVFDSAKQGSEEMRLKQEYYKLQRYIAENIVVADAE